MTIPTPRHVLLIACAMTLGACGFTTPIADASLTVYFAHDRESFDEDGVVALTRASDRARAEGAGAVLVTGHADAEGDDDYNLALSMRRAQTVRRNLLARGVAAGSVVTVAQGETAPAVEAAAETAEPLNRRVEIELGEPGAFTSAPDDAPFAFALPGAAPKTVAPDT